MWKGSWNLMRTAISIFFVFFLLFFFLFRKFQDYLYGEACNDLENDNQWEISEFLSCSTSSSSCESLLFCLLDYSLVRGQLQVTLVIFFYFLFKTLNPDHPLHPSAKKPITTTELHFPKTQTQTQTIPYPNQPLLTLLFPKSSLVSSSKQSQLTSWTTLDHNPTWPSP